jgi:hypothetical protein
MHFVVRWATCGIIWAAVALVDRFETFINSMLTIDTDSIFNDDNDTGRAWHEAWGVFRNIALGLIVIVALVMVISQAAGLEILDAYTIRKVLPRLLLAAIGITLSWQLLNLAVTVSNDLGVGVRAIIYTPFQGFDLTLDAVTGAIVSLFSVGAILALGWLALLALVVTAALAVITAWFLLVFREILIVMLIIVAPIAIGAAILPNTQKIWKLWSKTFMGALLMFLFISAFIAVGRVFAIASLEGGSTIMAELIAVIAYFAPYFLIPFTFKMAGGAMAAVGGIAQGAYRRANAPFAKARSKQVGQRLSNLSNRIREGKVGENGMLFNRGRRGPLGAAARAINTTSRRAKLGAKGRWGFGQKGHAAEDIALMSTIDSTLKNNPKLQALPSDDNANAIMAFGGTDEGSARAAARELFGDDPEEATRALNKARAVGWSQENALAAQQTMAQNKSRAVGAGEWWKVNNGLSRTLGNNPQLLESARQNFEYYSRSAGGRMDLGGVLTGDGTRRRAENFEGQTTQMQDFVREQRFRGGVQQLEEREGRAATDGEIASIRSAADSQDITPTDIHRNATSFAMSLDGLNRSGVQNIAAAHPHTITALSNALEYMDKYGSEEDRRYANGVMYEVQRTIAASPGENRDIINRIAAERFGIDFSQTDIAGQFARHVGGGTKDKDIEAEATRFRNTSRTYGGDVPEAVRTRPPEEG